MLQEEIQAENENPDPVVAAAMEQAREEEEALVQRQISEGIYLAKEKDAADEAAKQFIEEGNQNGSADADYMVTPNVSSVEPKEWRPSAAKPRKMRKRFVCRNGTWLRTKQLKKFKPGEAVWVRNGPGNFEQIGTVDESGSLPTAYL